MSRRIRFFYDVVCPYSYMETPRGRGGRGRQGRDRRVAASRAAPRAEATARAARRPLAHRLDAKRLPACAHARDRDPPAPLPASLDATARRVPVGATSTAGCVSSATPSTRRSSARARTSLRMRELARAAGRAGLDPDEALRAAYAPERIARLAEIRRARGRRGRPWRSDARRGGRRRHIGAWAASSASSPASRWFPGSV